MVVFVGHFPVFLNKSVDKLLVLRYRGLTPLAASCSFFLEISSDFEGLMSLLFLADDFLCCSSFTFFCCSSFFNLVGCSPLFLFGDSDVSSFFSGFWFFLIESLLVVTVSPMALRELPPPAFLKLLTKKFSVGGLSLDCGFPEKSSLPGLAELRGDRRATSLSTRTRLHCTTP